MDTAIEERILKMRGQGCGYRRIATETGVPLGTVRSWCRRREQAQAQAEAKSDETAAANVAEPQDEAKPRTETEPDEAAVDVAAPQSEPVEAKPDVAGPQSESTDAQPASLDPAVVERLAAEARGECPTCGAPIVQSGRGRVKRFCSTRCRSRWWDRHPELLDRRGMEALKCECCGRVFRSYRRQGRRHRRYCSTVCASMCLGMNRNTEAASE